jgi:agmatinase
MKQIIRLIGLPTDRHSSYLHGAAEAPAQVRAMLASPAGNAASETGLELGEEISIEDMGDLPLAEDDGDDAQIEAAVARAAESGATPICIGGDHSITFPVLRGLAKTYGRLNVLHFDAHPDLYDEFEGNRRSHASPFARIMEEGLATRLVQIGIRTLNRHQRAQAQRFGVEQIEMRAFEPASAPVLDGPLYVSVDLDGFDPAFAPGVSHPEPGGLTVREVLHVLFKQGAQVIGADVVELNPRRDINGLTAVLAAKMVKELAALIVRNASAAR